MPFLLFADIPYVMKQPGSTGLGSSFGTLDGHVPFYALTALGIILALIFARPPKPGESAFMRFGVVGIFASALATVVCFRIFFIVGMSNWFSVVKQRLGEDNFSADGFILLTRLAYWPSLLNPYFCAIFLGLAAWCVLISRRPSVGET